ncbi:MAG TPA: helix-turn-helix domain-containing protein [Pyrinomonadaceae bacterium]|jgi:excisionase family DNA binding protein
MEKRLLSIDEVAVNLNVSPTTVRRWVRSGKLVGQKAGVQWRFDQSAVREALEQGLLSGASRSPQGAEPFIPYPETSVFGRPLLTKWGRSLEQYLDQFQPDHVVVTDRRGSKIWSMLMPSRYTWGNNLWHSTIFKILVPSDLQRIFANKKVLLFDEIMQRGRELHELRQTLEGLGATVMSVVCVRQRSRADAGEVLDYDTLAFEDVDDVQFAERASTVSRMVSLFEPPLDVDHLIVKGRILPGTQPEQLLEQMAKWGLPFIIWHPDNHHKFLAVTLDRPQFFDTGSVNMPDGFSFDWEAPCKVRFYINLETGVCYSSFIVYPAVEGPLSAWVKEAAYSGTGKQQRQAAEDEDTLSSTADQAGLRRVYYTFCMRLALELFNDFVQSGAAQDIGIQIENSLEAIDPAQLRATFGKPLGEEMAKRTREIINDLRGGKKLFPDETSYPPPLHIRREQSSAGSYDVFNCRTEFLEAIPQRTQSQDGKSLAPFSYGDLLRRLPHYSESTVGRVLDYELDRGTAKPVVQTEFFSRDGLEVAKLWRGFYRGEFGVWFDFDRAEVTYRDEVIQRTLALGPIVVEKFLERIGESKMNATHFNKVFANLQHDWRDSHNLLYLGWRPYKYGPVAIVPDAASSGEYKAFERFLIDLKCLTETHETHQTQVWRRYTPASDAQFPWRKLYEKKTNGVTRAHVSGLVRLYAAIQKGCKTKRISDPRSSNSSVFRDPLVVLGSARNEDIAYKCAWFEVRDWMAKGEEMILPLLKAHAFSGERPSSPVMQTHLEEFAAPARLLFDKIEMYRNLPSLREQIEELCRGGDFDASEVLLETIDKEPSFNTNSPRPMQNLVWACNIMRPFSSLVRQILTVCGLDKGSTKAQDVNVYLSELLENCPEIKPLEDDLRSCIEQSKEGVLTEDMADCLSKTFYLILSVFDTPGRIPDPRPSTERDRERLAFQDGLIVRLRDINLPEPYTVSVADIRNLRNLPRVADIFGFNYEEALEGLLNWVQQTAREIEKRHPGIILAGISSDNVILAGRNADEVFASTLDLVKETTRRLAAVDNNQFAQFGLLRAGIALHENGVGDDYQGVRPGLIAYELGDKPGQALGTITVTQDVYELLSPASQGEFAASDANTGQGRVFARSWVPERDLPAGAPKR